MQKVAVSIKAKKIKNTSKNTSKKKSNSLKIKLTNTKGTSKKKDDVTLIFPVNPEKIRYKSSCRFQEYDILNKGTAKIPNGKDLTYISWESFFPGSILKKEKYVHNYKNAKDLHNRIETWRSKGTKLKLTITGTPINLYVYIDNYEASFEGPNGNIYYSIELSGAVDVSVEKVKKKVAALVYRPSKNNGAKKYTVKRGDCLWNIAKKFYKKNSKWKTIYNANKSTIEKAAKKHGKKSSSNGHWIYPGTTLKIP